MKQNRRIIRSLSKIMDLSAQPLPGIPIVELCGTKRLLIENHGGVMEYGNERIRIVVKYGTILVTGTGLEIGLMTRYQLIITGQIAAVQLERGRE